jgi:branched-chain amino acid transport system substrate-binding protein
MSVVVVKISLCLLLDVSFLLLTEERRAMGAEPVKIGMIASITGPAGFLGTYQKDAMIATVEDINRKGGVLGRPIKVYLEDDQNSPTNAVIAATKLIRDMKIVALIGPTTTDAGMAIAPICEQEHVPFVAYSPMVTPFKKWLFLLGPGDTRGASNALERAVTEIGVKRIALLHDTAFYGTTAAKIFKKEVKRYPGVSIIAEEQFETSHTNMIPQLMRLKAAKPDVIMLWASGGALVSIIAKNYKQLGMTTKVLCSGSVAQKDFMVLGGARIAEESDWVGLLLQISLAEKLPSDDPYRANVYEPFKKILEERYGKEKGIPNLFHVGPTDAINAIVGAIKLVGTDDRAAIRDGLERVRLDGLLGPFACTPSDHQGSPKDMSILAVVRNGAWVPRNSQGAKQ